MYVFRRIVAMLLIAVLVSSVMSSPVLRHTHAISDHSQPQREAKPQSHGHPHSHCHPHSHSHSRGHHDHDPPADVSHDPGERGSSEPTLTEAAVEHVHVVWLGFDLTLPALPSNSSDRSDTEDEWTPLLGEVVQIQVEATDGPNFADDDVLERAFTVAALPLVVPSAPPDVSQMCDTARRERSGVLRI